MSELFFHKWQIKNIKQSFRLQIKQFSKTIKNPQWKTLQLVVRQIPVNNNATEMF